MKLLHDRIITNLKTELASASPTILTASAFSPTNSPAACPTSNSDWSAATNLPPTPNKSVCDCMRSSLSCVVSDTVDSQDYGALFGTVCGLIKCGGIESNGTAPGTYGAYSTCEDKDQLSWAFNQYYLGQSKASSACNFSGSAKLQDSQAPSGTCASLISQAGGPSGTGQVTSSPSSSSKGHSAASNVSVGSTLKIAFGILIGIAGGMGVIFR